MVGVGNFGGFGAAARGGRSSREGGRRGCGGGWQFAVARRQSVCDPAIALGVPAYPFQISSRVLDFFAGVIDLPAGVVGIEA